MASVKPIEDVFKLSGGRLEGKYDVGAIIARGGFGVVYQARHRTLNKAVALKVLSVPEGLPGSESAAKFLEAFAREAQIVAKLDHPAVVKVLDFGTLTGPGGQKVPWMVMDWVEGETLSKHLSRRRNHGGRSPAECLALLRPVLEALAEAHEQGIAHRDIKPANLMVVDPGILAGQSRPTRRGAAPVRLLDFGIAKVMSPDEKAGSGDTWTERNVGGLSPHYAAPEQFARTRSGPWTDVHALGLILSEMLTDAAPYGGRKDEELVQRVFNPERPTPGVLGVDAGPWEPVIARALAIKPAERYQNAAELLHALEQSLLTEMTTPWRKPALVPLSVAPHALPLEPPSQSVELSMPALREEPTPPSLSVPSAPYSVPSTLTPSEIPHATRPRGLTPARRLAPFLAGCAALAGLSGLAFVVVSHPTPRSTQTPSAAVAAPIPIPLAATPVPQPLAAPPPEPVPAPLPAPVAAPFPAPTAVHAQAPEPAPPAPVASPPVAAPRVATRAPRTTTVVIPRRVSGHGGHGHRRPEEDHVPTE